MKPLFLRIVTTLLWSSITPFILSAQASTHVHSRVELVSPTRSTNQKPTVLINLQFKIPANSKIYAPLKDSPFPPPQLEWGHDSQNIRDYKILWPTPTLKKIDGLTVAVYEGNTVVPMEMTLKNPLQPLVLKGKVSYIVCSTLCTPITEEVSLTLPAAPPPPSAELNWLSPSLPQQNSPSGSLIWMVLLSFLGGVILNFMPCVLPILTLKVMTLKKISKNNNKDIKKRFFSTICGILLSFLTFAGITIFLKKAGLQIGWGMHFQEPFFLGLMASIMSLFACNLWGGIIEAHLSPTLNSMIDKVLGSRSRNMRIFGADFFSGAFATLLATPCTAPFLGTALGYSFSKGSLEIFLMFLSLGIGFAFPYEVGLFLPSRFLKLPKPGPWMQNLSRLLSVGMALTVIWILWILSKFVSWPGFIFFISALLTMIGYLIVRKKMNTLFFMAFFLTLAIAYQIDPPGLTDTLKKDEGYSPQTLDLPAIQQKVKQGKIIFVDIHARWCLTCHLNRSRVLNTPQIQELFLHQEVELVSIDWTTKDEKILWFLNHYHRYGIPFNMVFGPQAPNGIVLPEILSQHEVIETLKKAGLDIK